MQKQGKHSLGVRDPRLTCARALGDQSAGAEENPRQGLSNTADRSDFRGNGSPVGGGQLTLGADVTGGAPVTRSVCLAMMRAKPTTSSWRARS
jgi:hypothetical protein